MISVFPIIGFAQQNLIFNGDFEIYDTCPVNLSGPGDLQVEKCTGWTAPTKLGTSDYFNVCSTSGLGTPAGVPVNGLGFQHPYNGSGYCGIIAWDIDFEVDYREYLHSKLIEPLKANQRYKFSFFVSLSYPDYALKNIGAYFSPNSISRNDFKPIVAEPQIKNEDQFLTDTLNWTKVEGEFFAEGGENYITIGYFEDSLNILDTLCLSTDTIVSTLIYYYIDGITLQEVEYVPNIPNIFTPDNDYKNDTWYLDFPFEHVEIYNRWGNKVRTLNEGEIWSGKSDEGSPLSSGVYFVIIYSRYGILKEQVQLISEN